MSTSASATPVQDFELFDSHGRSVRLSSMWSERCAVLVFYPGDFTSVCTAQLCDYRNRWQDFSKLQATIVAINPEPWESHAKFIGAHDFPFPVLSDPTGACCKSFRAKAWWGTRRLVVVIDRHGIERWRKAVMPFSRQSADELLAAVTAANQAR